MTSLPRLNRRLTLEAPQQVADGAGGLTESWIALGTLWAEMRPRGAGREQRTGNASLAASGYHVTVRNAPETSPQRPRPDQRFRDGGRLFSIRSVTDSDPQGMYLTCFAVEEVAR